MKSPSLIQSNQLWNVSDAVAGMDTGGFVDGNKSPTVQDYRYDDNDFRTKDFEKVFCEGTERSSLTQDLNKGITEITYNHLNLPVKITFESGDYIDYAYNAAGEKVSKKVRAGNTQKTVEYLDGFQYAGEVLQFIFHAEGYVNVTTADNGDQYFNYVYNHTDHLGNIRVTYTKDPQTGTLEIMEENHYYPFGLKHEVYSSLTPKGFIADEELGGGTLLVHLREDEFKYKYNGKEWQDELGLNFYDYGARNYDPAIGRFFNIDNYAEDYRYINPYQYTLNNPVYFVDVNGDCIDIHYGKGQVESFCGDINSLSDQALQNDFVQTTVASYLLLKSAYSQYNTANGTDYQSDFVNLVENGDVSVGFKHSSGKSKYNITNETLHWNPDGGINSNGRSFSSLVVLEHEGSHANNHQTNTGLDVLEYYRQTGSLDGYEDKYNGTFFGDLFRKSPNSPDDNYEEDINAVGAETKAAKVLGELPKDTNRTRAKYKDGVEANNGFMKNKPSIDVLKKQIRDTQPKNKQDVQ